MPRMGGVQSERDRAALALPAVAFMSGYSEDLVVAGARPAARRSSPKPFTPTCCCVSSPTSWREAVADERGLRRVGRAPPARPRHPPRRSRVMLPRIPTAPLSRTGAPDVPPRVLATLFAAALTISVPGASGAGAAATAPPAVALPDTGLFAPSRPVSRAPRARAAPPPRASDRPCRVQLPRATGRTDERRWCPPADDGHPENRAARGHARASRLRRARAGRSGAQ